MKDVRVLVRAVDPVSEAGLSSFLQSQPSITLIHPDRQDEADVEVVATDRLSSDLVTAMRRAAKETARPVVLVIKEIADEELLTAVECRVMAIVPRQIATGERLVVAVRAAAAGAGALPYSLQGELIKQVERLHREVLAPLGLNASGLTPREIDVLRLMADGLNTEEIAERLCYSERTMKNVISGVTSRLKLRNRPHAVAYAMRAGLI
ncbi:helix-turn-helix transcriptional regulator [Lentzea sp. NPDC006480]|uniref:helix-turn-helix transcriptional regulator n=1 Tax=Lentzea sp. NPDC006480 TaxID=3157176 RepID=UPI0033AF6322